MRRPTHPDLRILSLAVVVTLGSFAACADESFQAGSDGPVGFDRGVHDGGPADSFVLPYDGVAPPSCMEGPSGIAIVWAHSSSELYRFDAYTKKVQKVGTFHGAGVSGIDFGMTDIAVTQDGVLYGLGRGYIYRIDEQTAEVTQVFGSGNVEGNAMTFLPAGEYDPSKEVLVVGYGRYQGGQTQSVLALVDIAQQTQKDIQTIAQGCVTSGDIVSVKKLGTYITLDCDNNPNSDMLAQLNVKTGQARIVGPVGFSGVWGLAFWCDRFYGFTSTGQLIEIDQQTGAGTLVASDTGAQSYWGAGVKTSAPVGPIK